MRRERPRPLREPRGCAAPGRWSLDRTSCARSLVAGQNKLRPVAGRWTEQAQKFRFVLRRCNIWE